MPISSELGCVLSGLWLTADREARAGPGSLDFLPPPAETKLFVGMLPRTVSDDELRQLFEQFGPLDEVSILRGTDGVSKGRGASERTAAGRARWR